MCLNLTFYVNIKRFEKKTVPKITLNLKRKLLHDFSIVKNGSTCPRKMEINLNVIIRVFFVLRCIFIFFDESQVASM